MKKLLLLTALGLSLALAAPKQSQAAGMTADQAVNKVITIGNQFINEAQNKEQDEQKMLSQVQQLLDLQVWGYKAMKDPKGMGLKSETDVEKVAYVITTAGMFATGFSVGMFKDGAAHKESEAGFKALSIDIDDLGGKMIQAGMVLVAD